MKDLVKIMEDHHFKDVRHYIQSGNLIFSSQDDSRQLTKAISQILQESFGLSPFILLLSLEELGLALKNNPFKNADSRFVLFYFAGNDLLKKDFSNLEGLKSNGEEFKIIGKVFYLHAPAGIGRSRLASGIEKALGCPVTGRNLNTVKKVFDLAVSPTEKK